MRASLLSATCALSLLHATNAIVIEHQSNIIGCSAQAISNGWNEITVNFDQIGLSPIFTTLDKIIQFDPANDVVGDEIVFDLDGYHQKYRISNLDHKTNQYTLKLVREKDNLPKEISFDWIPAPKVFWIYHASTNNVLVRQSGVIDNNYKKAAYSHSSNPIAIQQPLLKVIPVNADSKELHYTLQGGKIDSAQ